MVASNPLLDLRSHIGTVASKVRFDVLDRTLAVIGEITPARTITITLDTTASIIRALRGFTLHANDARTINPQADRIRPIWCLEDGTEWPWGVFLLSGETRRVGSAHTFVDATLMDQGFQLGQPMSRSFGVGTGGAVRPAMVELVEEAGIFDYEIDPTEQTVGGPINFQIGTSRTTVINALGKLAGFHIAHFDNDGTLRLVAPTPLQPGAGHLYEVEGPAVRVRRNSISENSNLLNAPNVYVVVCNGPSASEIVARAMIDPRLPHSIENRGFEVPKIIRMQGLTDTAHAQRIADAAAMTDPFQLETVAFSSAPDPRHDTFDVVEFSGGLFQESSWSCALAPGADHHHEITKQVTDFGGTDG